MVDWIFVLAAVSGVSAALAAGASFLQVRDAKRAREAEVYLRLSEEYGADAMREAIAALSRFWRDRKDSFSDPNMAYEAELSARPEEASKIRGQCRMLGQYFGHAARLFEGRLISKRLLKLLIHRPGLNVFYEVVVPINNARNASGETAKHAKTLHRVMPKHGNGFY